MTLTLTELFDYLKYNLGEDWQRNVLFIDYEKDADYWVYIYVPTLFEAVWHSQLREIADDFENRVVSADFINEYHYPDNYCDLDQKTWVNPMYKDLLIRGQTERPEVIANEILMRACRLKNAAAPSCEEFNEKLTTLEREALKAIRTKIADEGNISVVKMIQETDISRPIWTALLGKMKEFNFAEVENQGVKGTHIKFLN